ncbi:MAG: alpha-N-acetylglucosaminidase [Acidobacteria bacterium]|nr:alpha-N-acetylglucosaminidase [Acidobacteriota bacterium]
MASMRIVRSAVVSLLVLFAYSAIAATPHKARPSQTAAAQGVLRRVMPNIASQFHLSLKAGEYAGKSDGFRISGTRGNIHVEAATTPTLLYGVNWYLKYVARLNVSTNSSRLGKPGMMLPAVTEPIEKPALYPFRYALNENTDGYSTPYWDLTRWQHEIDILALSGFNAVLIQRGADMVMYKAFRDIGYTDEAIRNWITHPAHQNWQLMGNMCCFIEPISMELMQKRAQSARKIVDMLRSLGITPVLPGFYGVVPNDFAKFVLGAHVVVQAKDWNGFTRPGWLDPRDPAFKKLAASFYKYQDEIFGPTTIYDMETFQEGGDAGGVPIGEGAKKIQDALEAAHPGALWFMMAWQDNPKPELIDGVDRSKILIADIEQGRIPREDRDAEFKGARWLWGGLWEFGGRTTFGAPLYDYAVRMPLNAGKPNSKLSGTALFTEGIDTNPYAYDLYSEMAWHDKPVDLQTWTDEYAERRYGGDDAHAKAAWQIILKTAYGHRANGDRKHGERDAAHDSLFNAQPSLTTNRGGHWAPFAMKYKADDLKPALTELLQVAPELRKSAAYRYDLTDVARQVITNESRRLLPLIKQTFDKKDKVTMDALTAEWLRDMKVEEKLLATNEYFLLGNWLKYTPEWATSQHDREQINYDARSILTTWGHRKASEQDLHEYANRDWSGLVSDYYMPRWKMFFDSLDKALETNSAPEKIDWYAFGDKFNRSTRHYTTQPVGDTYAVAKEIDQMVNHDEGK